MIPPPIVAPFMPVAPAPTRFVKRGGYMVCCECQLAVAYCRCGERSADVPSQDGAESSLAKRVAEARGGAGGR